MAKVYIAGKITGLDDYKDKFQEAEDWLKARGHDVMNPAILPSGFEYEEYMAICFAMIDACDVVCMLSNWADSPGATRERSYAVESGKLMAYQEHTQHKDFISCMQRCLKPSELRGLMYGHAAVQDHSLGSKSEGE